MPLQVQRVLVCTYLWLLGVHCAPELDLVYSNGTLLPELLAGVPFGLRVRGTEVTIDDRVRIVSSAVQCGSVSAANSTTSLVRLPLQERSSAQDVLHAAGQALAGNESGSNLTSEGDGNASDGNGSTDDNTSVELQWLNLVLVQSGQYRVCHCPGSTSTCHSDAAFQDELGGLEVLGPATGHSFSCRVGSSCTAGPLTGRTSSGNHLRVMTSCNPPVGATGFLPGSENFAHLNSSLQADPMLSEELQGQGQTFNWGSTAVIGPGRRFDLCWCSRNCTRAEDFLVSVGKLEVPGPMRPLDVLCSVGRRCSIHMPSEYSVGFGNGDRILVSSACQTTDASLAWPNSGVSDSATDGGQNFQWSSAEGGTGIVPSGSFAAKPGTYKLCWCHRDQGCTRIADYFQDVGNITFAGPGGNQTWLCTRGRRCTLPGVLGAGLSIDDRFMLRPGCNATNESAGDAVAVESISPVPSLSSSSASVSWNRINATSGDFNLCWAPSWQRPSSRSCSQLNWDTTAGEGTICAATNSGYCELLTAEDAGTRCSSLGARLCLPHEIAQGEVGAWACDASWTSKACGPSSYATIAPDLGAPGLKCEATSEVLSEFLTLPVRRAWACCADEPTSSTADEAEYFSMPAAFMMTAGVVTVRGPIPGDALCVAGETCSVEVRGVMLDQFLDRLLILQYPDPCGVSSSTVAAQDFQFVNATSSSSTVNGSLFFSLGRASTFGTFHMCWCSTVNTYCGLAEDFNVHVGELLVGGISQQTVYCVYTQPCSFEIQGTHLGQADGIMLGLIQETCGDPLTPIEVEHNPAITTNVTNTENKTFYVGAVSRLESLKLCYCINTGHRQCISGNATNSDHFSTTVGTVEVRGPTLNATVTGVRAGVPYRLFLTGRLFQEANRITVHRPSGPACGAPGSNTSDTAAMLGSSAPSGVSSSVLVWDVTVLLSGNFHVCWCHMEPCGSSGYSVLAATLVVQGPLTGQEPLQRAVGNPFSLWVYGHNLASSDRIVIAPVAKVAGCGVNEIDNYRSLWSLDGSAPLPVLRDPVTGISSEMWLNAQVMAVGEYLVCWCGKLFCRETTDYNVEAMRLDIQGPPYGDLPAVTAADPFDIVLHGTALSSSDRIAIVDLGTPCGTLATNQPASAFVDISGVGVIDPPVYSTDTITRWTGLSIRWQGLYKVCWAGNYSYSRKCLGINATGYCIEHESANFPHFAGYLRVDYGNLTLVGQSQVMRCGSLDILAVPPQPTPSETAEHAVWSCSPSNTELCGSLHAEFLDTRARNQLALRVPADVLASGLDRARFFAAGRGLPFGLQNISLAVVIIDNQNVTRRGSLAVQVFPEQPFAEGRPSYANITTEEQLFLAVYAEQPGGPFCEHGVLAPSIMVTWTLQDLGEAGVAEGANFSDGMDLAPDNKAENSQFLILEPSAVNRLGVGLRSIVAHVQFAGNWPAQDIHFLLDISAPAPRQGTLTSPPATPLDCPLILGLTFPGNVEVGSQLVYNWSCSGPQGETCGSFVNPTALKQVNVFQLGSGRPGLHRISLAAEDAGGIRTEAAANVSTVAGSLEEGQWPVTIGHLPEVLGMAENTVCTAIGLDATESSPSHCAVSTNATWSILDLSNSQSSATATVQEMLSSGGSEQSLDTKQTSTVEDGFPIVTFSGVVPPQLLVPGGRYRCVLRIDGLSAATGGIFRVAEAPSQGWISVTPHSGTALATEFTLESSGWISEHLPLRHAFLAVPGQPPLLNTSLDPARYLRAWAKESGAKAILGISSPNVTVFVRVRDALGSVAQASQKVSVAPPTNNAAALASLRSPLLAPVPGAALAIAAAVVLSASPDPGFIDNVSSSGNTSSVPSGNQATNTQETVAAILQGLQNAADSNAGNIQTKEDLGLQVWVIERTLQLAVSEPVSAGSAPSLTANNSLVAAGLLAQIAEQSLVDPPKPATAMRFLAAVTTLVTSGVASAGGPDQAGQLLQTLRAADRQMGSALHAGMLQGAQVGGIYFGLPVAEEKITSGNMSSTVGWLSSAAASGGAVDMPTAGLQLELPALAGRRLAVNNSTATLCSRGSIQVQLTQWPASPVSLPPLTDRLQFEGILEGARVATAEQAGGEEPQVVSLRLWDCKAAAWYGAKAAVNFTMKADVANTSTEIKVREAMEIHTMRIEVSWECGQWDPSLGLWRVDATMASLADDFTVSCTSQSDPNASSAGLSQVTQDGYLYVAALPLAQTTFLYSEPVVIPEPERVLAFWRLWGLGLAVLLFQTILFAFLLFSRPADPAADELRPRMSVHAATKDMSAMTNQEHWCVLVPGVWLWDGLWQIRPWRLFPYSWKRCCGCCLRRRRGTVMHAQTTVPESSAKSVVEQVVRDKEASLRTQPGLRPSSLAWADLELLGAETVLSQQDMVKRLGLARRCCFLAYHDQRERHFRNLLIHGMDMYRRLMPAGDGHGGMGMAPASLEDEAFQVCLAHHIQQEIVTFSESKVCLSSRERKLLEGSCALLQQEMSHKPPTERPMLWSTFAPPMAVSVELLTIDDGSDEAFLKPGQGQKQLGRRRSSRKKNSKRDSKRDSKRASTFSGVVPQEGQVGWGEPDAVQESESQLYIPGATYFMWLQGRILCIHRSATPFRDAKAEVQALDRMLAPHELTQTYVLDEDVEELTPTVEDDGLLVLRLRGGLRLHWRASGEVRAWTSAPQPPASPTEGLLKLLVHGGTDTFLQRENPSIFYYRVQRPPHTACSVHLETMGGVGVHAYMWFSHGGAAVSFTCGTGSETQHEPELPGALCEDGSRQDPGQAMGIYLSDIISLEHVVRSLSYLTVLTLRDRRELRLCHSSRFARLACQSSILGVRKLVAPDAVDVVIRGHGSMASNPEVLREVRIEDLAVVAWRDEVKTQWEGMRGFLELKILSASNLGLKEPVSERLSQVLNAFSGMGKKKPLPKARGRTGMPSPKVIAHVPTQPPPAAAECRRTTDLAERTSNPIWNCTWHLTTEYSETSAQPGNVLLEVWDTAGVHEFLGEVSVPFPRGPQIQQHHLPLQGNPSKMAKDETRVVNGTVSFQLRWRADSQVEPDDQEIIPVAPSMLHSVCGTMRISYIKGCNLRRADLLSSDPYCIIHVTTAPKTVASRRTQTKWSNLNPVWKEQHEFAINWPRKEFGSAPVVKLELWDYDMVSSDEFLGEASFELPSEPGEDFLDLKLVPNRSKGVAVVQGHVQLRVHFFDEFDERVAGGDKHLTSYDQTFAAFFRSRPVDDRLARALAPSLTFFHFSFWRLLRGQLRRAWHLASCGLIDPGANRAGGAQARLHGYLSFSAWLWSALASSGVEIAQELINEQQLLLPGVELVTTVIDDQCDDRQAMRGILQKVTEQDASWVGLGGMACSSVCASTAIVAQSVNLPVVSYGCAASYLSDVVAYPGFARLGTALTVTGLLVSNLAAQFGWTRMEVLVDAASPHPQDADNLVLALREAGLSVQLQTVSNGRWEQFVAKAAGFLDQEVRNIFVLGNEDFMTTAACACEAAGITPGIAWLSSGLKRRSWFRSSMDLTQFDSRCTPAAVLTQLQGAINIMGTGQTENQSSALSCLWGYTPESFMTLFEERVAEMMVEGTFRAEDLYDGVAGLAADGVCSFAYMLKYMVDRGFAMSQLGSPTAQIYTELMDYIHHGLSFNGVSGNVTFDGNDKAGSMGLYQVQGNGTTMVGMVYINGTVAMDLNGGPMASSWTPHPPGPPPSEFPWLVVPVAIFAVVIVGAAAMGIRHGFKSARETAAQGQGQSNGGQHQGQVTGP